MIRPKSPATRYSSRGPAIRRFSGSWRVADALLLLADQPAIGLARVDGLFKHRVRYQ